MNKRDLIYEFTQPDYYVRYSNVTFNGPVLIQVWSIGTPDDHEAAKRKLKSDIEALQERLRELEE